MRFDNIKPTEIYPVGLFRDIANARTFGWSRLAYGRRYLRDQIKARNWRAVRNYFNGYLAEHGHCQHNAGKGWTRRAASRRVWRIHREAN